MSKITFLLFLGVCVGMAQSRISFKIVPPSGDKLENILLQYATPNKPITTTRPNDTKSPTISSPPSTPNRSKSTSSQINTIPYFIGDRNFIFVGGKHVYTLPPDAKYNITGNKIYLDGKLAYDVDTGEKTIPSYEPPSENPTAKLSPLFMKYYVFPGKIVQGTNGKIIIDGNETFQDDEFKNGHIRITRIKDALYLNDKPILKKNPQKSYINIPNPKIDTKATEFTIEISQGGFLNYRDNRRANYWYY